jgi:hypothetical protein
MARQARQAGWAKADRRTTILGRDVTDYDGIDLELDRAHSARMYDYFLGGVTNFEADRQAAGQALTGVPWLRKSAQANRAFVHRSARTLAQAGFTQFLDIGTGIPTSPNLHEIAQEVDPAAKVVYVDNDRIVLAHARALLVGTEQGRTAYVEADATDPKAVLESAGLLDTLDLNQPVALSLNALLHFIPDSMGGYEIVEQYKAALPSGSALVMSHATADFAPAEWERVVAAYRAAGTATQVRSLDEFGRFFQGWEPIAPGLVSCPKWRPDAATEPFSDIECSVYAGVALKP